MMTVRLAAVLLCMLYVSEAAFSISSAKCCTQLGEKISKALLKKVKSYEIQKQDGNCHLHAIVLYLNYKSLCMNPKNMRVRQWIRRKNKKNSGDEVQKKNNQGRKKRNKKNKKKKIRKVIRQLL
ncbi:C-C motif chemokine 28 [Anomaloglossus baeobatrachus]|uniref:C-C motif chemokine 28 n=1 Tax=Anomaloglossus baeobatrachus TaxID=238106 RepID=UPI003F4F72F3